jgi:hypothetical protein
MELSLVEEIYWDFAIPKSMKKEMNIWTQGWHSNKSAIKIDGYGEKSMLLPRRE